MARLLLSNFRTRVTDSNGDPYVRDAKLVFKDSSTSANKPVYSGPFEEHASLGYEVALDAEGYVPSSGVWLDAGRYDITAKVAIVDNPIADDDDDWLPLWDINYVAGNSATDGATSTLAYVNNVAEIRGLDENGCTGIVFNLGYYNFGDKGNGEWSWISTSTEDDDGGSVLKPDYISSSVPGRWHRVFEAQGNLSVALWGCSGGASDCTGNYYSARDYAEQNNRILEFVENTYNIGTAILDINGTYTGTTQKVEYVVREGAVFVASLGIGSVTFSNPTKFDCQHKIAEDLTIMDSLDGFVRPEWWGVVGYDTDSQASDFRDCMQKSNGQPILCDKQYAIGSRTLTNGLTEKTDFIFRKDGGFTFTAENYIEIRNIIYEKVDGSAIVDGSDARYLHLFGTKYMTSWLGLVSSIVLNTFEAAQTEAFTLVTDNPVTFFGGVNLTTAPIIYDFIGDGKWNVGAHTVIVGSLIQHDTCYITPNAGMLINITNSSVINAFMFGGNDSTVSEATARMLLNSAAVYGKTIDFKGATYTMTAITTVAYTVSHKLINGNFVLGFTDTNGMIFNGSTGALLDLTDISIGYATLVEYVALEINGAHRVERCSVTNGDYSPLADGSFPSYTKNSYVTYGSVYIAGSDTVASMSNYEFSKNVVGTSGVVANGIIRLVSKATGTVVNDVVIQDNLFTGAFTDGDDSTKRRIQHYGDFALGDDIHVLSIKNNRAAIKTERQWIPATEGEFNTLQIDNNGTIVDTNTYATNNLIVYFNTLDTNPGYDNMDKYVFSLHDESDTAFFDVLDFVTFNLRFWFDTTYIGEVAAPFAAVKEWDPEDGSAYEDATVGWCLTNKRIVGTRGPFMPRHPSITYDSVDIHAVVKFKLYDRRT